MKRDDLFSALWGILLGTALALASVMCLITAFDLNFPQLATLIIAFLLASAAGAFGFRNKWSSLSILTALLLGLGWLWRDGEATSQFAGLLENLSTVYDKAYGCGVIRIPDASFDTLWPTLIWGSLIALITGLTVSKALTSWGTITAALIPMMLCLVVTDTVPATGYVMLWIFCLALLILTAWARKNSPQQGSRLMAIALIPTALAVFALFSLNPKESYVNYAADIRLQAEQLLQEIQDSFQFDPSDLPELEVEPVITGSANPATVDLSQQGPLSRIDYPVMQVRSSSSGTLYLRGRSYDSYSGTGWLATGRTGDSFPGTATPVTQTGIVDVETLLALDALYVPYYPMMSMGMYAGQIPNPEGYLEYSFQVGQLPQLRPEISAPMEEEARGIDKDYLRLSSNTGYSARLILEENDLVGNTYLETANSIASYVRSSAVYDLNTSKMPLNEQDFAIWFLEESDRGYCVHFASATVVLLRAANIPARYVVGYMVPVQADQMTTVLSTQAHAWAEYYDPGLQTWIVLESTPAAEEEQPPQITQPEEPVQQTIPPQQTTAPSQPSQPTDPEDPAVPQTTVPSDAPEAEAQLPGWLKPLLIMVGILAALIVLIIAQRLLRLRLHQKWLDVADPNTLALRLWQESVFLAKLSGQQRPPRELEKLAQKAKYSQHTLDAQELAQLEDFLLKARQALQNKGILWQLVYRYIYVIY